MVDLVCKYSLEQLCILESRLAMERFVQAKTVVDYADGNMERDMATLVDSFGGWNCGEEVGLCIMYTCLEGFLTRGYIVTLTITLNNIKCDLMAAGDSKLWPWTGTTRIQLPSIMLSFKLSSSVLNFQLSKMAVVHRCMLEAGGAAMCTGGRDCMDTRLKMCREVVVMVLMTPRVSRG